MTHTSEIDLASPDSQKEQETSLSPEAMSSTIYKEKAPSTSEEANTITCKNRTTGAIKTFSPPPCPPGWDPVKPATETSQSPDVKSNIICEEEIVQSIEDDPSALSITCRNLSTGQVKTFRAATCPSGWDKL